MLFSKKHQQEPLQESNLLRAKKLYFINYANYYNMERNGEYAEYMKYNVSVALEQEWSRIIMDDMVEKLKSGEDIWLVGNLANIRINESEIFNSFQILAKSPHANEIFAAVKKAAPLIPPQVFDKIKKIFDPMSPCDTLF